MNAKITVKYEYDPTNFNSLRERGLFPRGK